MVHSHFFICYINSSEIDCYGTEIKRKRENSSHSSGKHSCYLSTSTSTEFVTVGEAIERVGCGFGTILYALGPYGVMITCGAEISVMTIVSLMVRCEWEMSTFSMSVLQVTGMAFFSIFSICLSNLGDTLGRRPVLIVTTSTGIGFGPAMAYSAEIPTVKYRALAMACNGLGWGIGTAFSL